MKKPKSLSKLKKLLWTDFSKFIRTRDAIETRNSLTESICITCNRVYDIKKLQAGHFIPGRANAYLFDEEQVHAQCYSCNMHKSGNWPSYFEYMIKKFGKKKIDSMLERRWDIVKFTPDELIEKRIDIKLRTKELIDNYNK